MSRAFSGKGDGGETSRWGGQRLPKNDPRIVAVGEIDEANASLGLTASFIQETEALSALDYLQNVLFTVGAEISAAPDKHSKEISENHVKQVETYIEKFDSELPDLRAFILPTGSSAVTSLHLARAVVRRAERAVVAANITQNPFLIKFLNRTSSLLFVMARWLNQKEGGTEKNPSYNL